MKIKEALAEANHVLEVIHDERDLYEALDNLAIAVEDFLTATEDYDKWQAVYTGGTEPEPGFTLEDLRTMLGFNEEGN